MKRIFAALVALFIAAFAALAFASPASATGDDTPSADNKKVTLCHYDGSNNNGGSGKYSKIEVSVSAFYNAGHIDHVNDIWEAFSYTTKGGDVVNVAQRGDVSRLAFDKCKAPSDDEPVTFAAATVVDKCGVDKDAVNFVREGRGWSAALTGTYPNFTVTVTAAEDFVLNPRDGWTLNEAKTVATKTFSAADFPNNDDCGLPETGDATTNVVGGIAVLALIGAGAVFLLRRRTA